MDIIGSTIYVGGTGRGREKAIVVFFKKPSDRKLSNSILGPRCHTSKEKDFASRSNTTTNTAPISAVLNSFWPRRRAILVLLELGLAGDAGAGEGADEQTLLFDLVATVLADAVGTVFDTAQSRFDIFAGAF